MDRFALFVDAGYLIASAGQLCHGVADRARLRLSPDLPEVLAKRCAEMCGLPHLRTYWYDAAEDLIPTVAHQELARRPRIKLRLGRLTRQGQKGVDSLAVRDMIRLATERAVPTAFLLSGDEDLRTGVAEAQDYGVEVVLIGVLPNDGEGNQSIALLREADEYLTLDAGFLAPYIELLPLPEPVVPRDSALPTVPVPLPEAYQHGRDFAWGWLANASSEDRRSIVYSRPRVPVEIDRELLLGLIDRLNLERGARFDETTRKALRDGFWTVIDQVLTPVQ